MKPNIYMFFLNLNTNIKQMSWNLNKELNNELKTKMRKITTKRKLVGTNVLEIVAALLEL